MEAEQVPFDFAIFGWRLGATLFFVLVNGFFVAAEFSLVKVRNTQMEHRAEQGSARARVVLHMLGHLDHYLSACQLGITIASLILGWLAETAIAELIIASARAAGWTVAPDDTLLHGVALAIALTIITVLHMTVGEQAPKIWAIQRAELLALRLAYPLRLFAEVFRPFIWVINGLSNGLLRVTGLSADDHPLAASHSAGEIKRILATSAEAGHITPRQLELARNVLDIMDLEVRHIMVPRVDVSYLSAENTQEENQRILQESGHSRFPLCTVGLDSVVGIVHAKEVLAAAAEGATPDLNNLARKPLYVSDTQPVSRLLLQLQRSGSHCCVVLDEHGTAVGLAFLEDAIEEIVGPIQDEFHDASPGVAFLPSGAIELPGALPLPEAEEILGLCDLEEESDTIGGLVVALLGRLPREGDEITIGQYRTRVMGLNRHRIERLRFVQLGSEG